MYILTVRSNALIYLHCLFEKNFGNNATLHTVIVPPPPNPPHSGPKSPKASQNHNTYFNLGKNRYFGVSGVANYESGLKIF